MSSLVGPFFKISCNNTECQSEHMVSTKVGDSPRSMAARVRDLLIEEGWTKDSRGMDRCPECSELRARCWQHSSNSSAPMARRECSNGEF
jgi:hypothetical protein